MTRIAQDGRRWSVIAGERGDKVPDDYVEATGVTLRYALLNLCTSLQRRRMEARATRCSGTRLQARA